MQKYLFMYKDISLITAAHLHGSGEALWNTQF
jgi:hypothetical protein